MKTIARSVLLIFIMTIFLSMTMSMGVFAKDPDGVPYDANSNSNSNSSASAGSVGVSPSDITGTAASDSTSISTGMNKVAAYFLKYLQIVGSIMAVLILAIYGIKWFLATAAQKAQLKEHMWAYVIGALFVFGAPQLIIWVGGTIQSAIK